MYYVLCIHWAGISLLCYLYDYPQGVTILNEELGPVINNVKVPAWVAISLITWAPRKIVYMAIRIQKILDLRVLDNLGQHRGFSSNRIQ